VENYRLGKLLALSNQVRSIIAKQLETAASFSQQPANVDSQILAKSSSMKKQMS
jgi:hypothetical protein